MNFKEKLAQVLQKLGLQEKAAKKEITQEEAALIAKTWKEEFNTEFSAEAAEWRNTEAEAAAYREIVAVVNGMSEEEVTGDNGGDGNEHDDGVGEDGNETEVNPVAGARRVIQAINSLNRQVRELASRARPDSPEDTVTREVNVFGRAHTATHVFGIEHPMFSMDRRWNRITRYGRQLEDPTAEDKEAFMDEFRKYSGSLSRRYAELYQMGVITPGKLGEVDYSSLKDAGLGEQFLVRRQDALIARILMIPNLDHIFPRRSNIQDGELLTNAFFGEFSQAYQAGEVSKGSVELYLKDSYYNMKEKIEPHMYLILRARAAMEKAGVTPQVVPIRGGTDGARLSYMGLPCPNLSTGGVNFHGVHEYIPVESLEKMVEVLINLVTVEE